jgi:hypothetical protein
MSDPRALNLPPPPRPQIAGQEAGRFNNQDPTQPQRAPDLFDNRVGQGSEDSGIVIDTGTGMAVTVRADGPDIEEEDLPAPAVHIPRPPAPFDENLAITLGLEGRVLSNIGAEVIQGVDADITSRQGWIDQYNKGIDLIGSKIEEIGTRGARRNVSRIGHPLMLDAMVKYQAGASAEMLPAMGPAKVPTIGNVPLEEEQRANNFEADLNYYFTDVATEYYPDTGHMLMGQAFCGLGYKKVFRCPIRRRPVSESVLAPDLIVSEEATDLQNAVRVTHRIDMTKSQLLRMQVVGQYRRIELGMPGSMMFGGSAQRKIKEAEGITIGGFARPEDQPYEILECDLDIDIDHHIIDGYWERRTPDGLMLPYKVAVERNSQQVLGMWRNWDPSDPLCLKQNMYVKFGLVPGFGFHDWGFLQLLGNQTRALRACWRLLIDTGMFSNFPGGIKNKNARTATNEIAPAPGEFTDVDAPLSVDLSKMFMPMPYKDVSPALVQFTELIGQHSRELAGSVMLETGEGRTNIPVGTIMAFVEDKVQTFAEVYKRNHNAQKEEFHKIRKLFAERPNDLWVLTRERPSDPNAQRRQWERAEEFTDLALRPASDPNVPSRIHRLMVDNVLGLLAQQAPDVMDRRAVLSEIITDLGKDATKFLVAPMQNAGQQQPDPRVQAKMIDSQTKQQQMIGEQQIADDKNQIEREKMALDASKAAAENETTQRVENIKQMGEVTKLHHEAALGIGTQAQPEQEAAD